ncbi:MAG: hypothetical protein WBF93_18700 [Pirellulales bacterium]
MSVGISAVTILFLTRLCVGDEITRASVTVDSFVPRVESRPAQPLRVEVSTAPLRALEYRVLPAPLTPGPAQHGSLEEYFWAQNGELIERFEWAKSQFAKGREGYRGLTLVAGAAGVGKTFIKSLVFEKDFQPTDVFKFDVRELYDQWAKEGICEARADLVAGDKVVNRLFALREHQTPHITNLLKSKDASFYVVDSLDEIHPDDYLTVLRQLQQFVDASDRPFVHVVVFGRGAAFCEFWQRHGKTTQTHSVALHVLNPPKLQTLGDWMVSSWNYHTWNCKLSWVPQGGTRQKIPLEPYRDWVASGFARDAKHQSVSGEDNSSTRAHVHTELVSRTSKSRVVAATIHNLAGNGITREIVQRDVLAGREYDEAQFMRAYLEGWLKRGTKSHGRPCFDQPARMDLYLYLLEQVAARYLHDGRVDRRGFFLVGERDQVALDVDGVRISVSVREVLDRSGLKIVDPREANNGRGYRFEPVWVHRLLVELHNERCRKAG